MELWNIYRKDIEGKLVCQVEATSRREALDKAEEKCGPDSRGWLYTYSASHEKAVANLPNFKG